MPLEQHRLHGAQIAAWKRCLETVLAHADRVDPCLMPFPDAELRALLKEAALAVDEWKHQLVLDGAKAHVFIAVVITVLGDANIALLVDEADRRILENALPPPIQKPRC